MKLTKATLKRLIKEEFDAMQEPQEPSEEKAFAIVQGLMEDLEKMEMIGRSSIEDYTDEDDTEAFLQKATKTLEVLESQIMPALRKMMENPGELKGRGMS